MNAEEKIQGLDFRLNIKNFPEFEKEVFNESGLYVPEDFTFPIFDAFCKNDPHSSLLGIQIKLNAKKEHIDFYTEGLKDYPGPNATNFRSNSKNAQIRTFLDRAIKDGQKFITVFISTRDDLTGEVFKELEKIKDERLSFYHVSAENILEHVGLTQNSIQALLKGF